jgi:hypothetical protein
VRKKAATLDGGPQDDYNAGKGFKLELMPVDRVSERKI